MRKEFDKLNKAFNPSCIAVVGDKKALGFMWLRALSDFKGKLYSVQIDPNEIGYIEELGIKNYSSLADVPEPVDLAIVAVPRTVAPMILKDCIQNNVAAAHFFTAGFAETDTDEGRILQNRLAEGAKQADFCLIGPNCMGIFNPGLGVKQSADQYANVTGPVSFISQSGTHAITFSNEAHLQGVDINKSVSFGNGIILDVTDYLEYFGYDTGTKAIGMYLEGVKDGNRFLSVLKEVSAKKPVVIWKGGRTEEGNRAIASHTGSLAIPQAIWDSAVRQAGAIKVTNQDELIDTLKALIHLAPVSGDRVALAGESGGQSVAIADAFVEAGLKVPLLTQDSYDKLATFINLAGTSYRNPIDTGANRFEMERIMDILEQDAHIDNLVEVIWAFARRQISKHLQNQIISLVNLRKRTIKPVMAILPTFSTPENVQQVNAIAQQLQEGNVPAYTTVERGALALKNALDYYRFKNNTDQ